MNAKPALTKTSPWLLAILCFPLAAFAQLPQLERKPWLGYHLAIESRRYDFGLEATGKGSIFPKNKSGKRISKALTLTFTVSVEETLPDGKIITRKIQPATLESAGDATDKLEKSTIRGQVTGGASFELHFENHRGVTSVGGRLTDRGPNAQNPMRLVIRINVPRVYKGSQTTRSFKQRTEDDRVTIRWTDGKRRKLTPNDKVRADSEEINGPGISEIRVDLAGYQGKRIEFSATENSRITLWNRTFQKLHNGFTINWSPDPEKDPDAESRLSFRIR